MLRQPLSGINSLLCYDYWSFRFGITFHLTVNIFKSQKKQKKFYFISIQICITSLTKMSGQPEEVPAEQPPQEKTQQQLLEQQKQKEEEERLKEQERKKQQQESRIKREEDMKKLDQALKGSLSGLAKSADNTAMVNVKMTLAEKEIERVFPNILRFNEILHLDMNTNMLSEIQLLTEFPNLITLNVSKNQIQNLKSFVGEKKLQKLQFLNLAGNKIKELTQISLPSLKKLNLNENQISTIKQFKGHQNLNILQLRKNKLRKLKGFANMRNLHELYVCQNEITDIRGLENLPSLTKLSIRNNKVKKIMSPFPYVPSLVHLNLRQNQISSLKQLLKIDDHVVSINILANPITDELGDNLKKEACWLLPHIIKINKSSISEEDRTIFEKQRLEKLVQEQKERMEKQEEAKKAAEQPLE